jgi:hypothetical protein
MKHLTPFKLFENMDNDILEIKDIFQDIADEWDIYWVDELDWSGMMSSLYKNKDYFVYTIREIVGNKDWQYLIDIVLPQNKEHKVWKNFKKFRDDLEICKERLVHIGFESSMILNDDINYQIAID